MCLGIPMLVEEIQGNKALASFMNVRREIRIDVVPDVKPGDYVMVHAGMAIEIMNQEEAQETLEMWKELSDEDVFLN
ncbi:MAG TPA: HypC/HybG/HupF family hydrogenase formation chaperone [Coprothermobacter sp.]|nr:HypC/HybG/HupF family hydrogenase formation chaperone [Coprothermobacter sp.]